MDFQNTHESLSRRLYTLVFTDGIGMDFLYTFTFQRELTHFCMAHALHTRLSEEVRIHEQTCRVHLPAFSAVCFFSRLINMHTPFLSNVATPPGRVEGGGDEYGQRFYTTFQQQRNV